VHPDDAERTLEALARATAARVTDLEIRMQALDGAWHWFSWSAAPGDDTVYAVGRDVTGEKKRTVELQQAQEALRQSQKLESMGQLTGGVAHDFNNLLTPIIGSLDFLQRRGIEDPRAARLVEGALLSAERAKTLVQRLLAFARRQPLQPTSVSLSRLVNGMADIVTSTTGPRVRLEMAVADDLPPVRADPNQLEMALLNLSVNARDAMPEGGVLTISAAEEAVGPEHDSRLPPATYVRLSVADTGLGMDAETLARAIEPFFSTKGVGKGTGLGLSMVHGLAAQLGGALKVESEPGRGTRVTLWLPVAAAAACPAHEKSEAAPFAASGTVLLVDDEEVVRASTADMLGEIGYAVAQAASAEEALRLLEGGLLPSVVISDHLMPGMSGTELAQSLRRTRPDMPVLIISGYAEADGTTVDFPRLNKPFRRAELTAALAALPLSPEDQAPPAPVPRRG
jgi:signal transduction histidine kinase/CheY-like chemotaxis protein